MTQPDPHDLLTVDIADGVITVAGEIDIAAGPVLDAALSQRRDDRPLVIDVGGVSFVDSSGLRSLLAASRDAQKRGTFVTLRHVGPEVWRLLEITGTVGQFTVESRRA
jgi:anti-anti-sigma factor